ncbi:hypothetical protein ACOMHN_001921 [Nucella lapillus]
MATTKHMETTVDSQGKRREVEVFVFNNRAKRKRVNESEKKNPPQQPEWKLPQRHLGKMADLMKLTPETPTLDLDKARQEVHSLGLSALEGRTKIEAQMAQLKRLGAKIPKNWERKMERKKRNQEIHRRRQNCPLGIVCRVTDRAVVAPENAGRFQWSSANDVLKTTPSSYQTVYHAPPPSSPDVSLCSTARPSRANFQNLIKVPLQSSDLPNQLCVCLFNAKSVGVARKRTAIADFLADHDVDLMVLTETWLRESGDESKIADLTPPGYKLFSSPRQLTASIKGGGGIAVIMKDCLASHTSINTTLSFTHTSFEDVKAGIKRKHIADPDKSAKRVEAEKQKKKEKKEGVFFDGQIGNYKHGVQYISSADIQSVRKQAGKGKR